MLNKVFVLRFSCWKSMLDNINALYLHRVFHGIRFKVNNEIGHL